MGWPLEFGKTRNKIRPHIPIPEAALDLTVADLLTSDMKWNKSRVEELLPLIAKDIQLFQPSHSLAPDIFVWQPLQYGIYTTRSGYYSISMKDQHQIILNSGAFDWLKNVWAPKCSTKMRQFLWSIINKAIPLGKDLQRVEFNQTLYVPDARVSNQQLIPFSIVPSRKRFGS